MINIVCRGGIHSEEMIEMKWSRSSSPGFFAGNLWNSSTIFGNKESLTLLAGIISLSSIAANQRAAFFI
jgi:hypothetical protein